MIKQELFFSYGCQQTQRKTYQVDYVGLFQSYIFASHCIYDLTPTELA